MNKKLYELVSAKKGASFKVEGVTLTLSRFSLAQAYALEQKGFPLEKLEEVMKDRPVEALTEVCYALLDKASKEQVGDSVDMFRACLATENMQDLMEAVVKTVQEGQPVSKK